MSNILDFEIPEKPRAKESLKVTLDKARKYDTFQTHIAQDIAALERDLQDFEASRGVFRIGYSNGYNDGLIATYKNMIEVLKNYLE